MPSLLLWNNSIRSSWTTLKQAMPGHLMPTEPLSAPQVQPKVDERTTHGSLGYQAGYEYKKALVTACQANLSASDVLQLVKDATQWCLRWPENDLLWQDLWSLCKQFKDQIDEDHDTTHERTILILIYHTRACVSKTPKKYHERCVNITPVSDEPLATEYQLASKCALEMSPPETRWNQRRTHSVSSYSSSSDSCASNASCHNCGTEKRAMPVCARCKTQTYCSHRCLVAHRQVHERDCLPKP